MAQIEILSQIKCLLTKPGACEEKRIALFVSDASNVERFAYSVDEAQNRTLDETQGRQADVNRSGDRSVESPGPTLRPCGLQP